MSMLMQMTKRNYRPCKYNNKKRHARRGSARADVVPEGREGTRRRRRRRFPRRHHHSIPLPLGRGGRRGGRGGSCRLVVGPVRARRPAPRDPRPRAKSATRDPRPRATRAARPGPDICQIPGNYCSFNDPSDPATLPTLLTTKFTLNPKPYTLTETLNFQPKPLSSNPYSLA